MDFIVNLCPKFGSIPRDYYHLAYACYGDFMLGIQNNSSDNELNYNTLPFSTEISKQNTFIWRINIIEKTTSKISVTLNLLERFSEMSYDVQFSVEIASHNDNIKNAISKSNVKFLTKDTSSDFYLICDELNTPNNVDDMENEKILLKGSISFRPSVQELIEFKKSVNPPKMLQELFDTIIEASPDPYADVRLISSEGACFSVHTLILAKKSPIFDAMFQTISRKFFNKNVKICNDKIPLNDIKSEVLVEILRYIYLDTIEPDILMKLAPKIMHAIEKYKLPEKFKQLCHVALQITLKKENVVVFLQVAKLYCLNELKQAAMKIILNEFIEIRQSRDWETLHQVDIDLVDEVYEAKSLHSEDCNIINLA